MLIQTAASYLGPELLLSAMFRNTLKIRPSCNPKDRVYSCVKRQAVLRVVKAEGLAVTRHEGTVGE
jgi:hypothetical protein